MGQMIGEEDVSQGLCNFEMQPFVSRDVVLSQKHVHEQLGYPNLLKLKLPVPSLKKSKC